MAPCTEIAILPLKGGINIHDASSEPVKILQENMNTLLGTPGMQRLWWGNEEENPSVLRLFVDWDDVSDHHKFMADPAYQPFMQRFGSLMDGQASLYHVVFEQHNPSNILGNGLVTETLTAEFPATISTATKASINGIIAGFLDMAKKSSKGPTNSTWGMSLENDIPLSNGGKGHKLVAILGWNSIADHMAFRETQEFKDNVHLLRELPDIQGTNLVHVKATPEQARGT